MRMRMWRSNCVHTCLGFALIRVSSGRISAGIGCHYSSCSWHADDGVLLSFHVR